MTSVRTISSGLPRGENHWLVAGAIALVAHGAAVAMVVGLVAQNDGEAEPEPVMIVELPPEGSEAGTALSAPAPAPAPQDEPEPQQITPAQPQPHPFDIPPTRATATRQAVNLPSPAAIPARTAPMRPVSQPVQPLVAPAAAAPPAQSAAPAETPRGAPDSAGDNPRAKAAEADYYSLLSAHLNRRKNYPTEAKKAMQQGIVTVRFTVARDGSVSAVSIRKSSGHELLDGATLDLMQRVAPLPRFPRSMTKDSVTISLPIEYSLRTS